MILPPLLPASRRIELSTPHTHFIYAPVTNNTVRSTLIRTLHRRLIAKTRIIGLPSSKYLAVEATFVLRFPRRHRYTHYLVEEEARAPNIPVERTYKNPSAPLITLQI